MDLTDTQWEILQPLIPQPQPREDGRGRPREDDRKLLDGMLWILRTGAQWEDLPRRVPCRIAEHGLQAMQGRASF